jgi:hypothetical protein
MEEQFFEWRISNTSSKNTILFIRVEVRLFVLSSEIEDRDEVEVATGRSKIRSSQLGEAK